MVKFKVQASKYELENIGISYDINGLEGTLVKSYQTGWVVLSITHKIGEYDFANEFDLPKHMLKRI